MRVHPLKVEEVPLELLSQHPDNVNNGDVEALEESIEINGFYDPIKVQRSTGYIVAGNHRYMIALRHKRKTIPAIYLDITDEQAIRIMLADNAITRRGFDDEPSLLNALEHLYATDMGLHGSGYDRALMDKLSASINEPLDFDPKPIVDERAELKDELDRHMRFSATPIPDEMGHFYEVSIQKEGMGTFSRSDVNAVRKAMGLKPFSIEDFNSFDKGEH